MSAAPLGNKQHDHSQLTHHSLTPSSNKVAQANDLHFPKGITLTIAYAVLARRANLFLNLHTHSTTHVKLPLLQVQVVINLEGKRTE